MTELGALLKRLMDEKKVDVAALAKAGGIDPGTVDQILAGSIKRPPDQRLRGFARALGVSFERLIATLPKNLRAAQGPLIEALDVAGDDDAAVAGGRWLIRVIRAGLSGNGVFYPDSVLREAVALFDGARVFVKGDAEHLRGQGKDVRNLIGRLVKPRFIEGASADAGEILAEFEVLATVGDIAARLREAWDRGMTGLFGFSIDAEGRIARSRAKGGQRAARAITKVNSVDLIVEPGAGGEVIKLIEAVQSAATGTNTSEDDDMLREKLIKLIEAKRPDLKGRLTDEASDDDLQAILTEAMAPPPAANANDDTGEDDAASGGNAAGDRVGRAELDERLRMIEARAAAVQTIEASGLPAPARERLARDFGGRESFREVDVGSAIEAERSYLARFAESGQVVGLGEGSRIEAGEQRGAKIATMLDAFFDRDDRSVQSFRECYVEITGDGSVTGQLERCDAARLREAAATGPIREAISSATFSSVLGNAIRRRMIKEYSLPSPYDAWRVVAETVPVQDFRTNERTRYGGYGDLPIVGEGNPYLNLATPTDEKATYAVAKRGGTELVTIETIKNDDVGVIARLPAKLARSARRTLAKFVLDFVRDNPAIYDAVALFHANHGNLGAAALTKTTLAAGRLAMLKQTEKDSGDRLGIPPRHLLVSPDLEETAVDLFRRNTENDKDFIGSLALNVVPIWYWTDVNDWTLIADIADVPFIEVGFLDGSEEPDLFVQDSPTQGSLFTNDQITYKIRHIYGGTVQDYRGAYKAVVA